jgi:hypothetical protein
LEAPYEAIKKPAHRFFGRKKKAEESLEEGETVRESRENSLEERHGSLLGSHAGTTFSSA